MKNNKGHQFHGILMLLCCMVPIMLIAALPLLNLQSSGLNNVLFLIFMMVCPLGHLIMMKFMSHKHQETPETESEILSVPESGAVD